MDEGVDEGGGGGNSRKRVRRRRSRRGAEKGKKQSFKDRRDDSYGKFGKRDAEAKGKAKGPGKNKVNKENVEEVGKGYFKKKFGVGKKGFKMADRKELSDEYNIEKKAEKS